MRGEARKEHRYEILGRAQCQDISALPGNVIDISAKGCKIFYSVPVTIHLEDEYSLVIQLADVGADDMTLICRPVWVNEDSGKTVIGMKILRSPDSERLLVCVETLKKKIDSSQDLSSQIVGSKCQFI